MSEEKQDKWSSKKNFWNQRWTDFRYKTISKWYAMRSSTAVYYYFLKKKKSEAVCNEECSQFLMKPEMPTMIVHWVERTFVCLSSLFLACLITQVLGGDSYWKPCVYSWGKDNVLCSYSVLWFLHWLWSVASLLFLLATIYYSSHGFCTYCIKKVMGVV